MVEWVRQGAAVVGELHLHTGKGVRVVLVGPRSNPKGAILVMPGAAGAEVKPMPLAECLGALSPVHVVEISSMQERIFGESELPVPKHLLNP